MICHVNDYVNTKADVACTTMGLQDTWNIPEKGQYKNWRLWCKTAQNSVFQETSRYVREELELTYKALDLM